MLTSLSLLQSSLILGLALISFSLASPIASQPFADLILKREQSNPQDGLTVDLGYSKYKGTYNDTTHIKSWKGIRFAASPTAELRWQAPQPPSLNRSEVIDASQYASQCPQIPFGNPDFQISAQYQGDMEDCLFLNVFAPENATNLPVMFWIHGGGYGAGNGQYDFTQLINANGNNFVGVAIQYRLGAFGFLASDELNRHGVVNAGIRDQHFAMQWVQAYIQQFGGDPRNVTIAGESAGGGSVMIHSLAQGGSLGTSLFKNVIAASPYLPFQYGYKDFEPSQSYYAFAASAGCFDATAYGNTNQSILECLVNKDAATLQLANVKTAASAFYGTWPFLPVTDGAYILDVPSRQLNQRKVNGKRLLVGNNGAEGGLFVQRNMDTEAKVRNWLSTLLPLLTKEDIDNVLFHYPVDTNVTGNYATNGVEMPDANSVSPVAHGQQARADNIYGELTFVCPSYWMSEAYSGSGRESYRYQYSVPPALHGNDVSQYFGPGTNVTSPDFVKAFMNIYGNFVTKDNPSIDAQLVYGASSDADKSQPNAAGNWPEYSINTPYQINLNQTGGTPSTMPNLGAEVTILTGSSLRNDFSKVNAYTWEGGRGRRCEFWRSIASILPS
ncbi:carboxylesterase [Pseudozyma hubeiensis SY62]|uniref:Carboxylic ester hydrolase n=1 Tax=Pseudozyma hubeiensis (strain SY62) TaxID=1305764 RepID=R9P068_PSEHS|nr:carboxylesterase [Pseudozyma hubeiensis SY62]GAC94387.1 carboxylesterase [Pseudozyma hubeiensis SY62]